MPFCSWFVQVRIPHLMNVPTGPFKALLYVSSHGFVLQSQLWLGCFVGAGALYGSWSEGTDCLCSLSAMVRLLRVRRYQPGPFIRRSPWAALKDPGSLSCHCPDSSTMACKMAMLFFHRLHLLSSIFKSQSNIPSSTLWLLWIQFL